MQHTTVTSSNPSINCSHNFSFQIADGVGRRTCSVTVDAPTREGAELYYRQNSPSIVQKAREQLSARETAAGPLTLHFP